MSNKYAGGCDHIHTHSNNDPIDIHTCHCSVCKGVTGQDTTHVVFFNHGDLEVDNLDGLKRQPFNAKNPDGRWSCAPARTVAHRLCSMTRNDGSARLCRTSWDTIQRACRRLTMPFMTSPLVLQPLTTAVPCTKVCAPTSFGQLLPKARSRYHTGSQIPRTNELVWGPKN